MLKANSSLGEGLYEILAIIPKYRMPLIPLEKCPLYYVIVKEVNGSNPPTIDYFTLSRYSLTEDKKGFGCDFFSTHSLTLGNTISNQRVFVETNNSSVIQVNFSIFKGDLIANLYTDNLADEKTITPDIDQIVRHDGALFASASQQETHDPLNPFKNGTIYVEPGSRVVDITFSPNRYEISFYPEQVKYYLRYEMKAYEDIYQIYLKYKNVFTFTEDLKSLITYSLHKLIAANANRSLFSKDIVEFFSPRPAKEVSYLDVRVVLQSPSLPIEVV